MTTTTPPLNGQVIGQAERATRALLDQLLFRTGTTFHQWVALNLLADSAPDTPDTADPAVLVDRMVAGLRIGAAAAEAALAELTAADLLEPAPGEPAHLRLTAAGRDRHRTVAHGIDGIAARLYRDLPPADLSTAARVLTTVTARAEAELTG